MASRGVGKNSAIEKALDILSAFIPDNQEMGTMELSEMLGFHKATASRILLTLTRRDFLQQDPDTKKFKLGKNSLKLGRAVINALRTDLVFLAKPFVDRLKTELETSVVLERMVNNKGLIFYVSEGPHSRVKLAGNVGDYIMIHAAAGAKAMLAFSDPAIVDQVIAHNPEFRVLTPNTITCPERFKAHLRDIRRDGYSLDNEEIDIGVKAIGVPVFNDQRKPIAALTVIFPAHRLGGGIDPDLIARIRTTAGEISAVLLMDPNKHAGNPRSHDLQ